MAIEDERKKIKEGICPVCGSKLVHQEGCIQCLNCGWSKCESI